jgi:hypothetical protein
LTGLWRERGFIGRLGLLVGVLVWSIPFNLMTIAWMTAINGRATARIRNKSIARLILEQLQVAFGHNIGAPWYFQFDLHDDRKRRHAGAYLHRFELKGGLYRMINRHLGIRGKSPLTDKAAFHDACRAAGLPTLSEVGVARNGALLDRAGLPVPLPAGDLFAKPCSGKGGRGAELWIRQSEGSWSNSHGQLLSAASLIHRFEELSRTEPYMIQQRALPHPDIADLSNGALPTARILTIKGKGEEWVAVAAVFRMSIGANRLVDNSHAGGIAASVDLATGSLGRATDMGLTHHVGWLDRHPDTGGAINGRILPLWPETLALAQRAHAFFRQRLIAGWDIAILADGPALVEGNNSPGTDLLQRPSGMPLGTGQFGSLFGALLLKAIERAGPHPW